jgi:transcription antitermination factor NusG
MQSSELENPISTGGDFLSSPVDDTAGQLQWHVLQTKPRQEKILAQDLAARKLEFFLPLQLRVNYHGSRKITLELPLFPGYLFLRGSLDDVYTVDRGKRVAKIIRVSQQDHLDRELKNIRLALEGKATLDPYPYLKTGSRAEVKFGPMRGLQGIVEQRLGMTRLVLQIDMLGQAVSLEIDGSLLDPLD